MSMTPLSEAPRVPAARALRVEGDIKQVASGQKMSSGLGMTQVCKALVLLLMLVPLVNCAAGSVAAEASLDNRLRQAQTASDEAIALYKAGEYARAEPLYQRALALGEETLGKNHPTVATLLNNLANLYLEQGLYARAEPLLQRALALREETLGKNHPDVAFPLNNLASLYQAQGLYARAEPLLQRALALGEETPGKNHPTVATSLNNLAGLYQAQGLYARAEPLFQRALALGEETLGKNHPDVATSLNNLANLYLDQGLYARAEPLLQRALALGEETLGKNHPTVAALLSNLANIYLNQGLYARAEPLLQRALALGEETLGKNHPDVATLLNNLALTCLAQQRLTEALSLLTRAFALSERRLRQEALDFSESRRADFLRYLRPQEEHLYRLLRAHPDDTHVRRAALSAALLLKGRSVEETADVSRTLYRSLSPRDRDTFEQLRGLRTQLATLSFRNPGSRAPSDTPQRIQQLTDQGDALEADLAKRSAPLRALTAFPSPSEIVDRVAASLPKDGALVELIAYWDSPLVSKPGTPRAKSPGQLRYLALVLFPDASTRAVDLGPAEPIDVAASRLRTALANRDASFQATAQQLHQLVFQPLLPVLGNTRRLFLSPDGQLGLVPFAALHDGHGFLVDSFDFTYLSSGRNLLSRPEGTTPLRSVAVFADPDFSASPPALPLPPGTDSARAERSSALEHFFSTLRADIAQHPWTPLPGTRAEALAIQRLLPQAQLFLGAEANKERLMHLPPPGILHVATHGFFLEDAPALEGSRAVGHFGALGDRTLVPRSTNPLLRSGLVLTGVSAPSNSAGAHSALVTALELAGLDLWGTQLVVMSACDTGRGDVRLGQGVYGLHRAFIAAGAETVVMSLWKVNDETTRVLMESYYRNLLAGQGRAAALREAMLALRQTRPHPHYWAPFIALGQDAPLRSLAPKPQESAEK
ncbi:CHAT domain-containing tetratricopeptide repeat protein [Archangium sp.]|uniref:CHAT domain-containing tetratricopeptide repeat protein n=1 Tax=Archangium sp. TaxID=1872627 RepID=UPI00286CF28F|nr:CHAT domain-containing tetratricopeptide repeat protein [Archangium sp.]